MAVTRVPVQVSMDLTLLRQLDKEIARTSTSRSRWIDAAIRRQLTQRKRKSDDRGTETRDEHG